MNLAAQLNNLRVNLCYYFYMQIFINECVFNTCTGETGP